jgi:hypothetical protein
VYFKTHMVYYKTHMVYYKTHVVYYKTHTVYYNTHVVYNKTHTVFGYLPYIYYWNLQFLDNVINIKLNSTTSWLVIP